MADEREDDPFKDALKGRSGWSPDHVYTQPNNPRVTATLDLQDGQGYGASVKNGRKSIADALFDDAEAAVAWAEEAADMYEDGRQGVLCDFGDETHGGVIEAYMKGCDEYEKACQ